MKNKTLFAVVLVLCSVTVLSYARETSLRVVITNPSAFTREHETVSLDWKTVQSHFSDSLRSVVVTDSAGEKILSQLFDSNSDGTPDALLFQIDLQPQQSKRVNIVPSAETEVAPNSLVDARFVEPREDFAWENDRIAFRMYGPAFAGELDNGIDVWVKRVRYLIVKKWYEGEEQTPKILYHADHGEGADFFEVGRSLGCGGTGILYNDTLLQPGVFSSYKIIATGPIRACFELYYDNWDVNGMKFKETKRITLDAGWNLNKIEEIFTSPENKQSLEIAVGLVKRPRTELFSDTSNCWMSLWGQTNDSLVNGYLGTGVVFLPNGIYQTGEDSLHYLMFGKITPGVPFVYYTGAGWTRSGDFNSSVDWENYLAHWSMRIREPLKVEIID